MLSARLLVLIKLAISSKGITMHRHQLTYIDLHPQPVTSEPSGFAIWLGAAALVLTLWAVTFIVFSL